MQVERNVDWSATSFPWTKEIENIKEEKFGIYSPFRPNQRECINASLSGNDCFVVMVSFLRISVTILSLINSILGNRKRQVSLLSNYSSYGRRLYSGSFPIDIFDE